MNGCKTHSITPEELAQIEAERKFRESVFDPTPEGQAKKRHEELMTIFTDIHKTLLVIEDWLGRISQNTK